jgi:hypothetical protein
MTTAGRFVLVEGLGVAQLITVAALNWLSVFAARERFA